LLEVSQRRNHSIERKASLLDEEDEEGELGKDGRVDTSLSTKLSDAFRLLQGVGVVINSPAKTSNSITSFGAAIGIPGTTRPTLSTRKIEREVETPVTVVATNTSEASASISRSPEVTTTETEASTSPTTKPSPTSTTTTKAPEVTKTSIQRNLNSVISVEPQPQPQHSNQSQTKKEQIERRERGEEARPTTTATTAATETTPLPSVGEVEPVEKAEGSSLNEPEQKLHEAARQSKVPSSRISRLWHFGSLAASLGVGALSEVRFITHVILCFDAYQTGWLWSPDNM